MNPPAVIIREEHIYFRDDVLWGPLGALEWVIANSKDPAAVRVALEACRDFRSEAPADGFEMEWLDNDPPIPGGGLT